MPPETESVATFVIQLQKSLFARLEQFTASRNWVLKVFLASLLFSVFLSGGLDLGLSDRGGYQPGYFQKIDHPLLDVGKLYGGNSHDANLNFRLTVPVILHVLGIHQPLVLPCLTVFAICLILVASCLVAYQLTQDRVCACLIALNVSATYVGSFGFIWYYDAIAISQMALAMLPRMVWWLRGILVFTAAFTDERAFVASGLLLAAYLFLPVPGVVGLIARLRQSGFAAVAAAMGLYGVARLCLMKFAGLSSPTGGNGPGMLVNQNFNYLHAAIWFALEGGWLLFGLALIALVINKERLAAAGLILAALGFLGFTLMIGDVLRSTIYIFPLLFVSLTVLSRNESIPNLRTYCLIAFLLSALAGNYNVYLGKITWFQPLIVHGLQVAGQAIYGAIYHFLPHTMPPPGA